MDMKDIFEKIDLDQILDEDNISQIFNNKDLSKISEDKEANDIARSELPQSESAPRTNKDFSSKDSVLIPPRQYFFEKVVHPLLISMGDPSGVGPEICVAQLFANNFGYRVVPDAVQPRPVAVLGSAAVLRKAAAFVGKGIVDDNLKLFDQIPVMTPDAFVECRGQLPDSNSIIVDFDNVDMETHQPGVVCGENGAACFTYIQMAIQWTLDGIAAGIVTAPIHKVALHEAAIPFPGHTEILAELTGAQDICMVLSSPELTTALVTAHVGMNQVPELITTERVWNTIQLNHLAWSKILERPPRLTVLGLNCHAGENGLFGNQEEELIIEPAIDMAREAGINIVGPIPPDTAFIPRRRDQTDVYICMYHDQGLIPLKMLGFDRGVNLTLGLPIVRTSVDHGTAMDIAFGAAGPGIKPSPNSLACAVELAWKMSDAE